ncbi:MAG TPA: FISUMP domain-containing protein [Bacteroidales bacterium]|nr:FISUMP domain-containing protein [Bacteroidales bacterium]
MKKILIILFICLWQIVYSQDVIIYVQAKHENTPVELDTIIIENLNNGSTANLYDLPIGHTNYEINLSQGAEVNSIFQNTVNNPSFRVIANEIGLCSFTVFSDKSNNLKAELFDIKGQLLHSANNQLNSGANSFEFYNGFAGMCIMKLTTESNIYSIKVIGDGNSNTSLIKTGSQESDILNTSKRIKSEFTYNIGDTIKITAKKINYHSNTIVIEPENDENYKIYISCPCTGIPTVTDFDGNIYNTVQIGNQCWMKGNMNTTHYADGTEMLDGTGVEDWAGTYLSSKYYFNYNDNPANSVKCGKLYTWAAAINGYVTDNDELLYGVRKGICPDGWHVPSDEEWLELEMYVDDSITIGTSFTWGFRGYDAGTKLKSSIDWQDYTNTDMFGFCAIPCGKKDYSFLSHTYDFSSFAELSFFWTASAYGGNGIGRRLFYDSKQISRENQPASSGYSVRCIKD